MASGYTEDSDYKNHEIVPVAAGRGQLALQRFQEQQARLPLNDALKVAQLQKAQAQLEFEGRAQLDAERTQANTLRQGAAFYAAKPVLEKYLRDNNMPVGSPGHAEAYANFASQFPFALRYLPDVAKTVQEHAEVHDLKAKMDQAIKAVPEGQRVSGVTLGTNQQVGIQTRPAEMPPDEKTVLSYATTQSKLAGAKSLQQAEIARQAKANTTPNTPYNPMDTSQGTNSAASIEASIKAHEIASSILEKQYPQLPALAAAQQKTNTPAPPVTAAPAATPAPQSGGFSELGGVGPAATPIPAAIPNNSQGIPQPQPAAKKPLDEIFGSQ